MDVSVLSHLPAPLLSWYEENRRILPWRENPVPYWVWVSEIMLQQTRVDTVIPYFNRFVETLPTIADLAAIDDESLMKLWEGLGYYSRVRNMKKAAQVMVEHHGGQLPSTYEEILALPGIGEYTAGAICSIAFGLPVPAVDGNVLRVVTRLCASREDISLPKTKAACRTALKELYPQGKASQFTQALMELGATVCIPTGAPKCLVCPAQSFCRAFAQGNPLDYPVKPPKKARKIENRDVYLLFSPKGLLLHKRPQKGLLAGLWELPSASQGESPALPVKEPLPSGELWGKAKHIFTHLEWHMTGHAVLTDAFDLPSEEWRWVSRQELLSEIALPSAFSFYREQALARFDLLS